VSEPPRDVPVVEEHLSSTPIMVAAGALLLYIGMELRGPMTYVGLAAFIIPLGFLWIREDMKMWNDKFEMPGVAPGHPLGWWGMTFFLATEVMFFASMFAAFFVARAEHPGIFELGHEHLSEALPLVTINTIILVTSGFFYHYALHSVRKNNRTGLTIGLLGTLLLGATFLTIQAREYASLINEGVVFGDGGDAFSNVFYGLTGAHGFHVFLGLVFIFILFVRAAKGQFNAERHLAVDAIGLYWHFVDLVWIGLYFVVYVGVI